MNCFLQIFNATIAKALELSIQETSVFQAESLIEAFLLAFQAILREVLLHSQGLVYQK